MGDDLRGGGWRRLGAVTGALVGEVRTMRDLRSHIATLPRERLTPWRDSGGAVWLPVVWGVWVMRASPAFYEPSQRALRDAYAAGYRALETGEGDPGIRIPDGIKPRDVLRAMLDIGAPGDWTDMLDDLLAAPAVIDRAPPRGERFDVGHGGGVVDRETGRRMSASELARLLNAAEVER